MVKSMFDIDSDLHFLSLPDEFTSAGMLLMVKSMFDIYDINKNGFLSKGEFDVLMDELGYGVEGMTI